MTRPYISAAAIETAAQAWEDTYWETAAAISPSGPEDLTCSPEGRDWYAHGDGGRNALQAMRDLAKVEPEPPTGDRQARFADTILHALHETLTAYSGLHTADMSDAHLMGAFLDRCGLRGDDANGWENL